MPLVGEGGGGQPPVNTVDVPVEGLATPPPPTRTLAAGRLGLRIMP